MAIGKGVKYFIQEHHYREVTRKELLRIRDEEVKLAYMWRSHLLEDKVFTASQLHTYEKKGFLTPMWYRGRKYFKKEEVRKIIEHNAKSKDAIQAALC